MSKKISMDQLNEYQKIIDGGKIGDFYDAMSNQGYGYAGWANGVAQGSSISGNSALHFLSGSAMMGIGLELCKNLSPQVVDDVRRDMAQGYLNTLKNLANDSGGYVDRDVSARETENFHKKAFEENGLSIDNWTLKAPFDIIKMQKGESALEDFWNELRDTGGSGPLALLKSLGISNMMGRMLYSPDEKIRRMAAEWMDNVPGVGNWEQFKRLFDVFEKSINKWIGYWGGIPKSGG